MYWLGCAKDHAKDTYRIYNPATKKLVLSRDVTFLPNQEKRSTSTKELGTIPEKEEYESLHPYVTDDDEIPPLMSRYGYVSSDDESDSSDDESDNDDDGPPNLLQRSYIQLKFW